MNSLFHATFSWLSVVVVSFKNSLIFTPDVTDASVNTCCKLKLVFLEKRLQFSERQYFEIRWGFYIKLNVSWLPAFLSNWCMRQTSRDRDKSHRVRTHEKKSGETVRRLGTIIKSIFLCPIRSRHPLEFLEIARWESVPRGSFTRTWKLSSRPFSRPDWLPLGLRGWANQGNEQKPVR